MVRRTHELELSQMDMKEEHQVVLAKAADDALMMKLAFDEHLRQMESEYRLCSINIATAFRFSEIPQGLGLLTLQANNSDYF